MLFDQGFSGRDIASTIAAFGAAPRASRTADTEVTPPLPPPSSLPDRRGYALDREPRRP